MVYVKLQMHTGTAWELQLEPCPADDDDDDDNDHDEFGNSVEPRTFELL